MNVKNHISDPHLKLIIGLFLILSIVIAYGKVIKCDFVGFDDQVYITENSQVQKGITLDGIAWAFTTFHGANWHPLTWLSHMLDCELYGLHPMAHHWTNLIFHMANTLLLFVVLELMTGAIWKSAFVAALFALHPLHVESVAWVSERKDVLSTFFGLLMIGAYYRYVKAPDFKKYALVFIFLCLGLMAKPMLVTFPFAIFLLDFWPLKRFQLKDHRLSQSYGKISFDFKGLSRLILEKIPLFVPVFISCILTFFAQKSEGAVQALASLPLKSRISNALVSYINYVLKAIWPSNLAVFYPHLGDILPAWKIFEAAFLIFFVCFFAIKASKKYPYIITGLFWYLGTLVPVIGLVQVGEQAMADRYTYIPLIGIFMAVVWGCSDLFRKWYCRKIYIGVFAVIILSALASRTFLQINYWKNGVTLFEHAIKVTQNNYKAHNNLATALGATDPERAISHYKAALRIHPNYVTALCNLGLILYQKGDYEQAASYFTKALSFDPRKIDTRMDLSNIFFLQGKPERAISQYKDILKTNYENADAHYNLACILSDQKKTDQAEFHYMEALRINPNYGKAHYNLGNIKLKQGDLEAALNHFAEAIKINPDDVQAYNKLGIILLRQRKFKQASIFFSKALQLDPDFSDARTNLGVLLKYRAVEMEDNKKR